MRETRIQSVFLFLFVSFFLAQPLLAQFPKTDAGKNRIQYKNFSWRYIETNNFDIYYYEGGYDLAVLAAKYVESEYSKITDMVGFSPYSKTKIFVYQSTIDLQQSNIGIKQQGLEIGGQTRFVRSEVEVAFTGNNYTFKTELVRGISDILIFEMMYGGNLKELLQSSYLLNLPEWFMAGASEYIAFGWSLEMDDFVRDLLSNTKFKNPDKLTGRKARLVGQAIWNYIAEKYGSNNIANILNLTRIVKNESSSIQNTLGVPQDRFMQQWQDFYRNDFAKLKDKHKILGEDFILRKNRKGNYITHVRISPDKRHVLFTENYKGKYAVKLLNKKKNRLSTILTGGYKVINQEFNTNMPLIAWKGNSEVVLIYPKSGKNILATIPIEGKGKKTKVKFDDYSHINGIDVSTDGRKMVFSGEQKGRSDLFIYNFRSKRINRLTNDIFDDIDPRFIPNSQDIVFSSNRTNDSLNIARTATYVDISRNFNIYYLDQKQPTILKRLTNTLSFDYSPIPITQKKIVYLSDQRGISHIFGYDIEDGLNHQISSYAFNINRLDVVDEQTVFTMNYKGNTHIYATEDFNFKNTIFTMKTSRQQIKELRYLKAMKKKKAEEKALKDAENKKDTGEKNDNGGKTDLEKKKNEVDTNNYNFDSILKKRKKFLEKFKNKLQHKEEDIAKELTISKSKPYQNKFTTDNFTTSVLIDPLRSIYGGGLGLLFEIEMTDIMENHKINGGLFGLFNINNSSFFVEYEYLKKRFDFKLRYDKKNLEISDDNFGQRYAMNVLEGTVSYPFNLTTKLSFSPFYTKTRYVNIIGLVNLNPNPIADPSDVVQDYYGFRGQFVYDNTLITGMNMSEGTRLIASYQHYLHFNNKDREFSNLKVELTHYQKLYRSLVLATRVSYGQFMGNAKKRYILGGMNNWIGSSVDNTNDPIINPLDENRRQSDLSDLLLSDFVTNMRGYDFNRMNGSNYVLLNAELRLPLLKFFYKGTVSSNFFRNLQLITFTDVGSAWTGTSPFTRKNSVNTQPIPRTGGFSGEFTNFGNPFLVGYGFGARTMILGYYMKLDVAWGEEDRGRVGPKFYFTLGYDF